MDLHKDRITALPSETYVPIPFLAWDCINLVYHEGPKTIGSLLPSF